MASSIIQQEQTSKSSGNTPVCIHCEQYLSVPPIYINSEGYWCGRCKFTLDTRLKLPGSTYHLTAYEALAKTTQFPCQYDIFGCTKTLNFENIKGHELTCKFRTDQCPIFNCQFKVPAQRLLEHCVMYHENFVLNPLNFFISADEDITRNYIISLNAKSYILSVSTSSSEKKMWINVYNFDFRDSSQNLTYILEVKRKGSNSLVVNEELIKKYEPNKNFMRGNMLSLDFKNLWSVLKGNDLIFSIRLGDTINSTDLSILEELECIVCHDYMRAPIYICTIGHSICSKCKNQIRECPFCRGPFGGARNFALEKLSEKTNLPNNKTSKSSKPLILESLEKKAAKNILKCPLEIPEQCKWIGQAQDIFVHSGEKHPTKIFGSKAEFQHQISKKSISENYVLFFNHNTFKLFIKYHDKNGPLRMTVLHSELTPSNNPQYRFILDVLDPSKKGKVLRIGCLCYSAQKYKQKTKDTIPFFAIDLPFYVFDSFVTKDNYITFTIEIKKVCN